MLAHQRVQRRLRRFAVARHAHACGGAAIHEPAPSRPLTMSSKACSVGAWRPASRSCASMGPWKVTKPA
ncbi:Uncharacterised protein [Bordetella pertussis]|nr:Uncharacterised protein [Bordetella pertussis]